MKEDWHSASELSGRYSWTIQIYLLCDISLSVGWLLFMVISHDWRDWYLFLAPLIITIPMLFLYSKPVAVSVHSQRLYIRHNKIDVTQRVKTVERQTERSAIIRFNFLYQLHVTGSPEQIGHLLEQLASYLKAT
ncbi:hypothetical protein [Alicyclobacillus hesperidum]|uniref:hypothetical protein n=1 Tax=Alicyclobacillus hesperidum TaxID=89784 RepID=UPI00249379AA|nr:hypothetical protein [Alicyclobacillus hesperidum]